MNIHKMMVAVLCSFGLRGIGFACGSVLMTTNALLPEGFDASNVQSAKGDDKANKQNVLSAEGQSLKDDIKVEYGEGHGETFDEALKEAMKDVLQKVVGVYVDSDFRMNNDEIIKDEIITHSNGFIDHYKKIEESEDNNGRGRVVTIKAWVKMRDFVNRMKKIAPSQTVKMDGTKLDVNLSNTVNAETLLRKELENLNPAIDLLDVALAEGVRPVVMKTTGETVTLRYVFQMRYSDLKYYKQFIPRISRVLDQIAETTPRNLTINCDTCDAKLYPLIYDFDANGAPKKDAVWKKYPVSGSCPRPKGLNKKKGECARVLMSYKGGTLQMREWLLSEYLYSVYAELCKCCTARCRGLSCNLVLIDDKGSELARGNHKISRRWYLVGGPFAHDNIDLVDFAPFFGPWNSEDSAMVKTRKDGRDIWDECWRYKEWFDRYVGCIDIMIEREDISKIKTAKVSLETNNEGENE